MTLLNGINLIFVLMMTGVDPKIYVEIGIAAFSEKMVMLVIMIY